MFSFYVYFFTEELDQKNNNLALANSKTPFLSFLTRSVHKQKDLLLFFKTPPTHLRVNHVLPTQLTPAGELNAALLFLSFPQEFLQRVHSPTKTEYRTCVVEFRDWISLKSDWSDLFRWNEGTKTWYRIFVQYFTVYRQHCSLQPCKQNTELPYLSTYFA